MHVTSDPCQEEDKPLKKFPGFRAATLACVLALPLASAAHADTLIGTTDPSPFEQGYGVNWYTWFDVYYPGAYDDFALSNVVTADDTGVLQATGIDYPVTPSSITVTDPFGNQFYSSDTVTLGLTDESDFDFVLFQGGSTDPVTFTFTSGSVSGFGINIYGFSPLESVTMTAYNASDALIGSVAIDSPTQFVGILDNAVDIASVTLSTGNDNNYAFGSAVFTTPEPGTFLLFSVPLAAFLFNRVRRRRSLSTAISLRQIVGTPPVTTTAANLILGLCVPTARGGRAFGSLSFCDPTCPPHK